jgi:ABC-type branched-subunit amino acid transport system ATPase component
MNAGLIVSDVTVRFGGVTAVDGLSLEAPTDRITGLIGPNGAGKTTTFNVCSGLANPTSGTVQLDGQDVTRLPPAGRARRGLGRTFQRMELFSTMTVAENVSLGHEASLAGRNPLRAVLPAARDSGHVRQATEQALAACGIAHLAGRRAGNLSTGEQRLVEFARVLAGRFSVLLLDEPSSGLDRTETSRFGRILRQVSAERTVGILIVEHDMDLVMAICEYIYVLDFGKLIFAGTPDEVRTSQLVRAAYLGDSVHMEVA